MPNSVISRKFQSYFYPGKEVEVWYCNDCCNGTKLHRLDGPAFIAPGGTKCWFFHGTKVTPQEIADHLARDKEKSLEKAFKEIHDIVHGGILTSVVVKEPIRFIRNPSKRKLMQ